MQMCSVRRVEKDSPLPLVPHVLFWYTKNMAKSIKVRPKLKKKVGRPATGRDPTITVRLPPEMIEQIEQEATLQNTGRSQVVREALQKGLGRKR